MKAPRLTKEIRAAIINSIIDNIDYECGVHKYVNVAPLMEARIDVNAEAQWKETYGDYLTPPESTCIGFWLTVESITLMPYGELEEEYDEDYELTSDELYSIEHEAEQEIRIMERV